MKTHIQRTTVYLDSDLHRALRIKAAETDNSISELVSEAVKLALAEDAVDIAAFNERKKEPSSAFDDVLKRLKADGKI